MMEFNRLTRLTDEEFKKFSKLIYEESGIFLRESKITLLSNRLRKRLKALNLDTFSEYFNIISRLSDKTKEIEALIDVVSTNETYFFRNEKQFEALTTVCFPELAARKDSQKKLRIWSAGCSTGEEPYSISICILDNIRLFQNWKIEIIATDIAPSVLEFARKGVYSGRRIEKVSKEHLNKYFIQDKINNEFYAVTNNVKSNVYFSMLNLFKDPYPTDIDIIFCRNVMIYFDKEHQRKLLSGFYASIQKSGYLFLGHSETIHSISDDFIYRKILNTPIYIPG